MVRCVIRATSSTGDEAAGHRDERRAEAAVRAGSVPIHGAAIAAPLGNVVLAGVSGSGKSTLAAAAALSGWGYIADEVAAVDPTTLTVAPYHRPIGLRRAGAEALGLRFPAERTVPGDAMDWPIDPEHRSPGGIVRLVALVTWQPDSTPACDAVTPAQAMVELLQHLVVDDAAIAWCFGAVERIVRAVPVVRLTYSDPPAGLAQLTTCMESDA